MSIIANKKFTRIAKLPKNLIIFHKIKCAKKTRKNNEKKQNAKTN